MESIKKLAKLMHGRQTVVLTGAGVSTESNIPDFRTPGTGLWSKIDPMELFARNILLHKPATFWQRAEPVFREMATAKPNPAHYALAKMEDMGVIRGVITQNIDNLHQAAGSNIVLEVHGHLRTASCPGCGGKADLLPILDKVKAGDNPPLCSCGEILRPDVVLFGDPLPDVFQVAWQWAGTSDLLLVVGSSLEVAPVCWLVPQAKEVAIISLGPTQGDEMAELVIKGKAGEVLSSLVEELEKLRE